MKPCKKILSRGAWTALLVCSLVTVPISAGQEADKKAHMPEAVAQALQRNCPNFEIARMSVEKEEGITLFDIEFKAGKGEIEIAEDGTVMDIAVIIPIQEVPRAAVDVIQKAAEGASILQWERSEVRAELRKEKGKGKVVKLESPRTVYEAELVKGRQKGEIQVAPEGTIVEALKWGSEKETKE